jgi:nitrate reductase NapD
LNLSGIVVTADPARIDAVRNALAGLPGVEVHRFDRASGRLVVVQEAADVGAEMAGFLLIRALPHVLGADLVIHHLEPPPEGDRTEAIVDEGGASHAEAPAASNHPQRNEP